MRPSLRRKVQIAPQLAGDPRRSASNLHQCIQKADLRGFSLLRCAKTGHLTGFEATNPHKSPHNMHRCKLRADLCGPDARWEAVCIGMQVGFGLGQGCEAGIASRDKCGPGPTRLTAVRSRPDWQHWPSSLNAPRKHQHVIHSQSPNNHEYRVLRRNNDC